MAKAGMRRPDPKDPHGTESNRKTHFPKNEVAPVPEIQGTANPARFTYSEIVHFTFAVFFVLVQLTDTFTRYTKSIPRGNR